VPVPDAPQDSTLNASALKQTEGEGLAPHPLMAKRLEATFLQSPRVIDALLVSIKGRCAEEGWGRFGGSEGYGPAQPVAIFQSATRYDTVSNLGPMLELHKAT
jgi:hypothetical protein